MFCTTENFIILKNRNLRLSDFRMSILEIFSRGDRSIDIARAQRGQVPPGIDPALSIPHAALEGAQRRFPFLSVLIYPEGGETPLRVIYPEGGETPLRASVSLEVQSHYPPSEVGLSIVLARAAGIDDIPRHGLDAVEANGLSRGRHSWHEGFAFFG